MSVSVANSDLPSSQIGRYKVIARLASGGMASVYLASAQGLGEFSRLVAIKRCHPHLGEDDKFRTMFLQEANLAAQIHHGNVVATLDVGLDDGIPYLVMEYHEGGGLSELLKAAPRGPTMPQDIAVGILTDILCGLHAAHSATSKSGEALHIVHRDVSPQNIMVATDGVARILDFGVAKAADNPYTTQNGEIRGKLAYMTPEQLTGKSVSAATDVFAAGLVAWEMLAGERLFNVQSQENVLQEVLYAPIPELDEIAPHVPRDVCDVIMKAVRREPKERFESAQAFAEALSECCIKPARPKAIATYVQTTLGERLRDRRELIQTALSTTLTGDQPLRDAGAGADNDSHPSFSELLIKAGLSLRDVSKSRRWTAALIALIIVGSIGWLASSRDDDKASNRSATAEPNGRRETTRKAATRRDLAEIQPLPEPLLVDLQAGGPAGSEPSTSADQVPTDLDPADDQSGNEHGTAEPSAPEQAKARRKKRPRGSKRKTSRVKGSKNDSVEEFFPDKI